MSRQNTVEIIVKVKDATGGFDSSKRKVKKFAEDVKKDLDDIEEHGGKVGNRTGKKISEETVKAAKGTGEKVGKEIADGISKTAKAKLKLSGESAGKDFGLGFSSAAGKAIGGLKGTILGGADGLMGAIGMSGGMAKGLGVAAALPFAAGGLSLAGGVAGGLGVTAAAGGVVGLAALLLKDNPKVEAAWEKTLTKISAGATKSASVMADEFVKGAEQTAAIWETNVGPKLSGVFTEAQPLVEKFIGGLGNAVGEFLPGLEEMTKNAGPVIDGFGNMLGSIFKGAGDGLADLSKHGDDLKTTLELAGDGIGAALKGGIGFLGDLSAAVARNEDDFRRWGRNIADVAKAAGNEAIYLTDLFASMGGDWKDGQGNTFLTNLRKSLGYQPNQFDKKVDMPGIPKGVEATKIPNYFVDNATPGMKKNMQDGAFDFQAEAASKLTRTLGALNVQKIAGVKLSNEELAVSGPLVQHQQELVLAGNALTLATGSTAAANNQNLSAMLEIAAAGLPVHDSLMQVVSGMSDAELAAIGATVTTDALGNSVINIPGHKPITLSADASKANPPIDGVIGRLGQVQDKHATISVTTVYSVIGNPSTGANMASLSRNIAFNKGGLIPGGGPDRDSVPILATPGEFVVNRAATQANRGFLERLNESAGGSATFAMAGGGGYGGSSGGSGGGGGTTIRIEWGGGPADDFGRQVWSWLQRNIRVRGGNTAVLP